MGGDERLKTYSKFLILSNLNTFELSLVPIRKACQNIVLKIQTHL